eukprot:GCRY01000829.1.p1 GENE.GCRY01000829.1~~GCRY01000829.1.p1  ORF type:complete len:377 (+),score=33.09 GCRY01000829.1:100-1230(+)
MSKLQLTLLFVLTLISVSFSFTVESDLKAIQELRRVANGDNWLIQPNWEDPCTPPGLFGCLEGSIFTVFIPDNNVTGDVSDIFIALSGLKNLSDMEIGNNKIHGTFQKFIESEYSIPSLMFLIIENAEISGPAPNASFLSKFNLMFLKAAYNKFSGPLNVDICRLKFCDLSHSNLVGHSKCECCGITAKEATDSNGFVEIDIVRMGEMKETLNNTNVADVIGDAFFLAFEGCKGFYEHAYVFQEKIMVRPPYGLYQFCVNHTCSSADSFHPTDPVKPVGYLTAPHATWTDDGVCTFPAGSWFSLNEAGYCSPAEVNDPSSECSWYPVSIQKAVHSACVCEKMKNIDTEDSPKMTAILKAVFETQDPSQGGCPWVPL